MSSELDHLNKILKILKNKNISDETTLKKVGQLSVPVQTSMVFHHMLQYGWDSVENINIVLDHKNIEELYVLLTILYEENLLSARHQYILSVQEIEALLNALSCLNLVENDKGQSALSNAEFELKLAKHDNLPVVSELLVFLEKELRILKYDHINEICNHPNPQEVLDCLLGLQENSMIASTNPRVATEYYKLAIQSSPFCGLVELLNDHNLLTKDLATFLKSETKLKLDILKTNSFKELEILKDKIENDSDITTQEMVAGQNTLTSINNFVSSFVGLLKKTKCDNNDNLEKFSSNFILLLSGFYPLIAKNILFNPEKFNQKTLDSIFNFCSQYKGNLENFPMQFQAFVTKFEICTTGIPREIPVQSLIDANLFYIGNTSFRIPSSTSALSSSSLFNRSNSTPPKTSSTTSTSVEMTFSSGPSPMPSSNQFSFSSATEPCKTNVPIKTGFSSTSSTNSVDYLSSSTNNLLPFRGSSFFETNNAREQDDVEMDIGIYLV